MFDYLAIDWGSKRVGLAYGQKMTGLVIGDKEERETKDIFEALEVILTKRKTKYIVVGRPLSLDMKETEVTHKIDGFVKILRDRFPLVEIVTFGERGTSKMAVELIGNEDKFLINHQAASLVLERYFEATGSK